LPALSRLESGKNLRPSFETFARYAAGVGLEVTVVVRERGESERRPPAEENEVLAVRSADLDRLLATIHGQIDAIRTSSLGATSAPGSDK
jgi:transcriptional regulator with XRE-family HTH domain